MARIIPLDGTLTDPFWLARRNAVTRAGLAAQWKQIVQTGRLENFHRVARGEKGTHEGMIFNDSDVYKWLEAAGYALQHEPDLPIRATVEEAVNAIEAAQSANGYLNTYFQLQAPEDTFRNLIDMHEMYCAGHLIEGAVALADAGLTKLLGVARRFADLLLETFGPEKRRGYCGHEEIEYALMRLTDATGDPRYGELGAWMVRARGQRPSPLEAEYNDPKAMAVSPWRAKPWVPKEPYTGEYNQDHLPVAEHTDVVGHAVRAMYLYLAAARLPEPEIGDALRRAWDNLTNKRMYITGGIGPSAHNEGFTTDFDLPNRMAYAETCAAVGLAFWGQAMFEREPNAAYIDVVERALYNGSISGISLDGTLYFYTNPLESRGEHARFEFHLCACCPPNIARMLTSISRRFVAQSDDTLYLNIPAGLRSEATFNGVKVPFEVDSDYPHSGEVTLRFGGTQPVEFTLAVRVPEWCEGLEVDIEGHEEEAEFEAGYALFRRTWSPGEEVRLSYEMEPRWMEADPRVLDNLGRVALTRGPLVFCLEEADLGELPQRFRPFLGDEIDLASENGLPVLKVRGEVPGAGFPEGLYADAGLIGSREVEAKFIPYFAWNNRGPGHMVVWVHGSLW